MILFIDTTRQNKAEIALADKSKTFRKVFDFNRNLSEILIPEIQRLFKNAKRNFSELSKIAVVAGPGSYTGVRVGVATANAFAYSLKIPIIKLDAGKFKGELSALFFEKGVIRQISPIYRKEPNITRPKRKF